MELSCARGTAATSAGEADHETQEMWEGVVASAVVPEAVVVVTGPFEGAAVEKWRNLITEAVALQAQRLVVDLTRSTTLDAAAIVVLLGAHREIVCAGGRLTLRGPSGRARRVLRLARVERVFDIERAQPAAAPV
jgi:anti-anti-sigma factor